MAHKSDTQADSENMPQIPYTLKKPSGIFTSNIRYPNDLIEAGLVETEFRRKSLGTRDWKEAKKAAAQEFLFFSAEVETLRSKMIKSGNSHSSAKSIRLSDLTKQNQRQLVLAEYVEMERKAVVFRKRVIEEGGAALEIALESTREDIGEFEGKGDMAFDDWRADVSTFLERKNIEFDPKEISDELLLLYQKAVKEVHARSLRAYSGKSVKNTDRTFADLHEFSEMKGLPEPSRTVGEVCCELFEMKASSNRSPATLKKYTSQIEAIKELIGETIPISQLDPTTGDAGYRVAKEVVSFIPKIAVASRQRYPGLSLKEASRLESKNEKPRFIEPKTQHDLLIGFQAMFNLAVKRHWINRSPFEGLHDSLPRVVKRDPVMFTGKELTTLLSSPDFLRERSVVKKGRAQQGRFWCVLMCLFHGMRLNEVASLLVSDVREEGGIDYLDFNEFDDDGNLVKRLKTVTSRRRVPIHREIIKIGFLDYVKQRHDVAKPTDQLFPEFNPDTQGNLGGYVSKWFTRTRNKIIGKQKRRGDKSIRSFRHSVADAIRSVTDSDEILYAIGGWGDASPKNSAHRYGKGDMGRLKSVVDQIEFKDFDPSFLYPE